MALFLLLVGNLMAQTAAVEVTITVNDADAPANQEACFGGARDLFDNQFEDWVLRGFYKVSAAEKEEPGPFQILSRTVNNNNVTRTGKDRIVDDANPNYWGEGMTSRIEFSGDLQGSGIDQFDFGTDYLLVRASQLLVWEENQPPTVQYNTPIAIDDCAKDNSQEVFNIDQSYILNRFDNFATPNFGASTHAMGYRMTHFRTTTPLTTGAETIDNNGNPVATACTNGQTTIRVYLQDGYTGYNVQILAREPGGTSFTTVVYDPEVVDRTANTANFRDYVVETGAGRQFQVVIKTPTTPYLDSFTETRDVPVIDYVPAVDITQVTVSTTDACVGGPLGRIGVGNTIAGAFSSDDRITIQLRDAAQNVVAAIGPVAPSSGEIFFDDVTDGTYTLNFLTNLYDGENVGGLSCETSRLVPIEIITFAAIEVGAPVFTQDGCGSDATISATMTVDLSNSGVEASEYTYELRRFGPLTSTVVATVTGPYTSEITFDGLLSLTSYGLQVSGGPCVNLGDREISPLLVDRATFDVTYAPAGCPADDLWTVKVFVTNDNGANRSYNVNITNNSPTENRSIMGTDTAVFVRSGDVGFEDMITVSTSGTDCFTFGFTNYPTPPPAPVLNAALTDLPSTCDVDGGVVEFTLTNFTDPVTFTGVDPAQVTELPDGSYRITGIAAGDFSLSVTDAVACTRTFSTPVTLENVVEGTEILPALSLPGLLYTSCNGVDDAVINPVVTDNFGTLYYTLNGGAPVTIPEFTDLGPGDYTLSVIDSNTLCVVTGSFTVYYPGTLQTGPFTVEPGTCDDGIYRVSALVELDNPDPASTRRLIPFDFNQVNPPAGPDTVYTNELEYSLDGGSSYFPLGNFDFTAVEIVTGIYQITLNLRLTPGEYDIRVRINGASCTASGPGVVTDADFVPGTFTAFESVETDDPDCVGELGSVTVTLVNAEDFTYVELGEFIGGGMTNPVADTIVAGSGTVTFTFENVPVSTIISSEDGNHQGGYGLFARTAVTATGEPSGQTCTIFSPEGSEGPDTGIPFVQYEINPPPPAPAAGFTWITEDFFCDFTGPVIELSATGGTPPYEFSVGDDGPFLDQTVFELNGENSFENDLQPAINFRVRDANGCVSDVVQAVSNGVLIEDIEEIIVSGPLEFAPCEDQTTVTVTVTGGTLPFDMVVAPFSADDLDTVTITELTTEVVILRPTVTDGQSGGAFYDFFVDILDARTCRAMTTFEVLNLQEPEIQLSATDASCGDATDGSLTVTVNAGPGTTGWTSTFIDGVEYPDNPAVATGLSAGQYTIVVTDDRGCSYDSLFMVGVATTIVYQSAVEDAGPCAEDNTGRVTITPSGGTAPYSVSLAGNPTQSAGEQQAVVFEDLNAGEYALSITDASGCSVNEMLTVGGPLPVEAVLIAQDNPTCNGADDGSLSFTVSGGTEPLLLSLDGGPAQAETLFTDLAAGTYLVLTVIDANGCTTDIDLGAGAGAVLVNQSEVSLSTVITPVNCFGEASGGVTLTATGGTEPYTYALGDGAFQPDAFFGGLTAGAYDFTVVDGNDCTTMLTGVTVTGPAAALSATTNQSNVSCNGAADGGIGISASGGTPGYTYSLNGGAAVTLDTLSNLTPGAYDIVVTDARGCLLALPTLTIGEPATVAGTTVVEAPLCADGAGGSIAVIPTGGTPPFAYSLAGPVTIGFGPDSLFTDLPPGSYAVRWRDANGCVSPLTPVTIEAAPAFSLQVDAQTDATCGEDNGTVSVSPAAGGVGDIAYDWSSGATGPSLTGLAPGDYTVTATDANDCTAELAVSIGAQDSPVVTAEVGIDTCGTGRGSIALILAEGTPPFVFSWDDDPLRTDSVATGLLADDYSGVVTDGNGCTVPFNFTVGTSAPVQFTSVTVVDADCGAANGQITVTTIGGTGALTYAWSDDPLRDGPVASGLAGGNYSVTVTGELGCQATVDVAVGSTSGPTALTADELINTTCGLDNGGLTLAVTGGVEPYTFSWSDDAGRTGPTATDLAAGDYGVTATDDNGCTVAGSFTIGASSALMAEVNGVVDASCGQANGEATVTVSGATQPVNYVWGISPEPLGPTATGLLAGTYTVVATDAIGCSVTVEVVIAPKDGPTIIGTTVMDPVCEEGTGLIEVSVEGGTGPFIFSWSHDPALDGPVAANLPSGTYVLTVTDITGCFTDVAFTLEAPDPPSLTDPVVEDATCGAANGSITVSAAGGTGSLTYTWSHDAALDAPMANGLAAGPYSVTVTDENGCTDELTATVGSVAALTITEAAVENTTCGLDNGSIAVTADGEASPYTYAWSHDPAATDAVVTGLAPGAYTVTVTDNNGCSVMEAYTIAPSDIPAVSVLTTEDTNCGQANGSATVSISGLTEPVTYAWGIDPEPGGPTAGGLAAGSYTVTVTGSLGCSASADVVIDNTDGPSVADVTANDPACTEGTGSISVTITGGVLPYTYDWSVAGAPDEPVLTGLSSGTYDLTVTDAEGCEVLVSETLDSPAPPLFLAPNTSPGTCGLATGAISLNVDGGTGELTFTWSHDGGLDGPLAENLLAGTYDVTVTDALGCSDEQTINLDNEDGPTSPTLLAVTNTTCGQDNGSLSVGATGGAAPLTYTWNHDPDALGPDLSGLAAGDYTVTVTDANGCFLFATFNVGESTELLLTVEQENDATCGQNNGSATVAVSNATGTVTYNWGILPEPNGPTATNLPAGDYTVTAEDESGCFATISLTIGDADGPTLELVTAEGPRCTEGTGSIAVSGTGGLAPLTYAWSHDEDLEGPVATDLNSGDYTVTVTDASGCTASLNVSLDAPVPPVLTTVAVEPASCGAEDGSILLDVTGGTGPLTYAWSHDETLTGPGANDLAAGDYTITITDALGCTDAITVTVAGGGAIGLMAGAITAATCGEANGTATVEVTGGTAPLTYTWSISPPPNGPTAVGLAGGDYGVTVTDASGCSATVSLTVGSEPGPVLESVETTDAACGQDTGLATLTVSGGTGVLTYVWGLPVEPNGPTATGLAPGDYTVSVTDENDCLLTVPVTIDGTEAIVIVGTVVDASCSAADGSITLDITGGTPPYTIDWADTTAAEATLAELSAGMYAVTVTGSNGCTASATFDVGGEAGEITILEDNLTNPGCAGGTDGEVRVLAIGANGPFSYAWSTGASGPEITGLAAGDYTVTVTDDNGCTATATYTLSEGAGSTFDYAVSDTTICRDDLIAVDLSDFATVLVTGDNGFTSSDPVTLLDEAGTYTLTVTDPNGCTGTDEFTLNVTQTPLTAGMVLPTDVVLADTLVMLETSFPLAEEVSLLYDQTDMTLVGQEGNQYRFTFAAPGTYELGLVAESGGCSDVISKLIVVHPDSSSITGAPLARLEILSAVVAPNPNAGQFTVDVQMSAVLPLVATLYRLDGSLLDRRRLDPATAHLLTYDESLEDGTYLLSLQTAAQRRVLTIVVVN